MKKKILLSALLASFTTAGAIASSINALDLAEAALRSTRSDLTLSLVSLGGVGPNDTIKTKLDALTAKTATTTTFNLAQADVLALNPGANGGLAGAGTLVDGVVVAANIGQGAINTALGTAIPALAVGATISAFASERDLLKMEFRRIFYGVNAQAYVNGPNVAGSDYMTQAALRTALETAMGLGVGAILPADENNFTLAHLVRFLAAVRFKS